MKVSDIFAVAAWSLFAGLIAFIVLNHNVDGDIRTRVIRWLFRFGALALAAFVVVIAFRAEAVPFKAALLLYIGMPALVAAVLLQLANVFHRRQG